MREVPERIGRLPDQYFTALLARVASAAAQGGEPLVDLGRGNPEIGPPAHVVHALTECAERHDVHGYAPFAGLPALKEAIATRYGELYDVHLDPAREVAVLPGTKTGLMEFALCAVEDGCPIGGIPITSPPSHSRVRRTCRSPASTSPPTRCTSTSRRIPPQPPSRTDCSKGRSNGPTGRARGSSTTSLTATSSSTVGARRAFSRSRTRSASASNCSACQRRTGWRVGDSGSRSATQSSFAASSCCRITRSPGSSARCKKPGSQRSPAHRTRWKNVARPTSAGVTVRWSPSGESTRDPRERSSSGSGPRTVSRSIAY